MKKLILLTLLLPVLAAAQSGVKNFDTVRVKHVRFLDMPIPADGHGKSDTVDIRSDGTDLWIITADTTLKLSRQESTPVGADFPLEYVTRNDSTIIQVDTTEPGLATIWNATHIGGFGINIAETSGPDTFTADTTEVPTFSDLLAATFWYGTGELGDVTLDGTQGTISSASYTWVTKTNDTLYTLGNDAHFSNLTIKPGIRLNKNGFRLYVLNTLNDSGTISNNGGPGGDAVDAVGATPGSAGAAGAAAGNNYFMTQGAGVAGAINGLVGNTGVTLTASIFRDSGGATGGAGGKGGCRDGNITCPAAGGGAGPKGSASGLTAGFGANRDIWALISGRAFAPATAVSGLQGKLTSGSGGSGTSGITGAGGGQAGGAAGYGGGSGAVGGWVVVCARIIMGNGVIESRGGDGGDGGDGGAATGDFSGGGGGGGGGGAGGGGIVTVVTNSLGANITLRAPGGSKGIGGTAGLHGSGAGTAPENGADGQDGPWGRVFTYFLN